MHKRFLFSLLLAALAGTLLLGSCGLTGSSEKKKAKSDSTFFLATLNGNSWRGGTWVRETRAVLTEGKLVIAGYSAGPQSLWRGSLLLGIPFTGPKTYSLVRGPRETYGAHYLELNGDVRVAGYFPTEDSSANQLTITSYDSTTGIMTGTFHTTLVITEDDEESEPGEPPRRQPDTLRFTDGEFRVKVEDRRDQ